MPIPALNADGFLPAGVFDCTLLEFKARFGSSLYKTYVDFFSLVREAPGARKGLLRLRL
jgi:hypothetical protein